MDNEKTTKGKTGVQKKHIITIICCAVAVILIAVLCFFFFSSWSGNNEGATTDEAALTVVTDEDAYIFSEGIFIGSTNAAGKSYRQMREAAENEVDTLIKDFSIEVTAGKEKFTYKKADFTFGNNIEILLQQAATYNDSLIGQPTPATSKTFDITFEVNEESVETKVKEIAKKVDVEPKNATIAETDGDIGVIDAVIGKKVDQPALTKAMVKEINSLAKGEKTTATVIKAKVVDAQPELEFDDLNGKITLLASYTSVSTNGANGNHNMALALSACNGSVIQPGEVWSFNACTGDSNLTSNGYLPATVIMNGRFTDGIGGGICQASTTIYNAAIRTNMEIVERYSHYFESSYADAGRDATIDYPNLDLKLGNPSEYPMYLQCYMSGSTLYCNIYGYQDPSYDEVRIDSWTYDENYAANNYSASATRTFLKNGEVVKVEYLPDSNYAYYSPSDEKPTKPTKPTTKPTETTDTTPSETETPTEPSVDPTEPTAPPVIVTDPPVSEAPTA